MTFDFRDPDPTLTTPHAGAAAMPQPGESWRMTTVCTVEDIGALPRDMVAFRVAGSRHYVFPLRAGLWRPADVPTAEVVLETRIDAWERAAMNTDTSTSVVDRTVARAVVEELATIRSLISRGTFQ